MDHKQIMKHAFSLWEAFRKDLPELQPSNRTIAEWAKDKKLSKREIHDIHEVAFILLTSEGRANMKAAVLAYLMSGKDLDDITAATKIGCRNLSATISKLRDSGWAIGKEERKTNAGQMSTFYYLAEVR